MSTRTLNLDDYVLISDLTAAGYTRERAEDIARRSSDFLALQAQRDALLSAAKAALAKMECYNYTTKNVENQLREAIAAAESNQQES